MGNILTQESTNDVSVSRYFFLSKKRPYLSKLGIDGDILKNLETEDDEADRVYELGEIPKEQRQTIKKGISKKVYEILLQNKGELISSG